ncbi:hypothetical protein Lpp74_02554 [Lacticaseibacillus paracasei subsp. paracasei Lpp74]|uniref:Uncharacterized protein n=1 Tax=Lacticaseibacillus paracasei subsp. paracasei Lpp126 TaxID=1256206 RepID=S2SEW4_LACPA|nr:hypothetical protein LCAZH_2654 [Lacticaseibacillus paracasei]EPC43830.1 hypothetical protein Lpp74_02554 [Lacticaseibacillus paracasei subsp. paracasei Lpp74]EPC46896.1 hypothetical protein Lpp219_01974 [Lacticaseibacillus paracasei subsp. paracasei Lpp219]EPC82356.1 hypothetical protein Lpp126_05025 [Lacticaseibacillus paracasei subsp. paracasei Lpp126]EPC87751.1 hypothetical protein Lpp43_04516 [Lacticaseibacillus paracasei subsp. paracasei Lpp43]EPC95553.1 hypothetical protein Lpp27_118
MLNKAKQKPAHSYAGLLMYWPAGGRPTGDFYFGGVKMKKLGWGL